MVALIAMNARAEHSKTLRHYKKINKRHEWQVQGHKAKNNIHTPKIATNNKRKSIKNSKDKSLKNIQKWKMPKTNEKNQFTFLIDKYLARPPFHPG